MSLSAQTRRILRDLKLLKEAAPVARADAELAARALRLKLESELAVEVQVDFAKADLGLPSDYIEMNLTKPPPTSLPLVDGGKKAKKL